MILWINSMKVSSPSPLTTTSNPILRVPKASPVGCGPPAIKINFCLKRFFNGLIKLLISHNWVVKKEIANITFLYLEMAFSIDFDNSFFSEMKNMLISLATSSDSNAPIKALKL